jgi:hypothetical protein
MSIIAWVAIVLVTLSLIVSPFSISKPREPYTAGNYVALMVESVIIISLAGRVLKWW